MKRRDFNRSLWSGLAGMVASSHWIQSCERPKISTLRVLHTSNFHSSFEFEESTGPSPEQGFNRLRLMISRLRREVDGAVLLFDSGDFTGGTFEHRLFGGNLECAALNELGYDAITLGDSDFSGGLDRWKGCKEQARFDLICSNYDLRLTPLGEWSEPCKVYERLGLRIGVYALGPELAGLVPRVEREQVVVGNPLETALYWESELKDKQDCDLVFCLSHLGFSSTVAGRTGDLQLARELRYTDLILGGHAYGNTQGPIAATSASGQRVIISQAAAFGQGIGVIDFTYERVGDQRKKPVIWNMKTV